MINVFIYHKNQEHMKFLHKTVDDYFRSVKHSYRIFGTSNCNEAAAYIQRIVKTGDIFFFDFSDFEMMYKFAAFLRHHNSIASWVHIGNIDSLLKTLHLRPSAFIENPEDKQKITEIVSNLDDFHQKIQIKKYFFFKYEGENMRIDYDNIDYFESNAKKVILHFNQDKKRYCFTAKLSDIETNLPAFFLRCHQSYIVNMKKIRQINLRNHTFILNSNDEVFISKRMFVKAKDTYNNYVSSLNKNM